MARPSFFTAAGWRAHRADVAAFHAERLATIALEPLQGNNVMNATRADALRLAGEVGFPRRPRISGDGGRAPPGVL